MENLIQNLSADCNGLRKLYIFHVLDDISLRRLETMIIIPYSDDNCPHFFRTLSLRINRPQTLYNDNLLLF